MEEGKHALQDNNHVITSFTIRIFEHKWMDGQAVLFFTVRLKVMILTKLIGFIQWRI